MSTELNNIDLTPNQRKAVAELLKRYIPDTEVWAYGSRVKFTSTPKSDLDLVAFATPEQKHSIFNLKEAFEESNLPFRVDLFIWNEVPEQFHKNIEAERVVLQAWREERVVGSEWEIVKLGDLLELLTDYHANGSYKILKQNVTLLDEPDYAIMIRTTNFEKNEFDTSLKYITEDAYNFLKKSKVFLGDIIMTKIANAGSCYYVHDFKQPVSLAMNLFLLRIDQSLAISKYVFFFLKSNEAYVKNFAEGSVTKTITKAAGGESPLPVSAILCGDQTLSKYFTTHAARR